MMGNKMIPMNLGCRTGLNFNAWDVGWQLLRHHETSMQLVGEDNLVDIQMDKYMDIDRWT